MGLMDKMKAGVANAGTYTSQKADESSYNLKISDQRNKKKKLLEEAGDKMFALYQDGKKEISDEIKDMFEQCIACDKEIEKLEAEKAEMIAEKEKERQDRRDKVQAQEEQEKADREAKKAAEKE